MDTLTERDDRTRHVGPARAQRPARHAGRSAAVAAAGLALVLAGCGTSGGEDGPDGGVGIANPASVNCIELGGTLEIVDGPTGQTGWCTLLDGRRVEEWELYRETHGDEADWGTDGSEGTGEPDAFDREAALAELEAAEARWRAAGIARYRLVERPVCFCVGATHTLLVEDGVATEVTTVPDAPDAEGPFGPALTVEELLARLRADLEGGAAAVRATYDPSTGAPMEAFVDVSELMADEEWGMSVLELERLD
ncbi:MAG: hypothetical protein RLZZ272_490 [Actinomycetota bacterium]|jgi:putative hemolysin